MDYESVIDQLCAVSVAFCLFLFLFLILLSVFLHGRRNCAHALLFTNIVNIAAHRQAWTYILYGRSLSDHLVFIWIIAAQKPRGCCLLYIYLYIQIIHFVWNAFKATDMRRDREGESAEVCPTHMQYFHSIYIIYIFCSLLAEILFICHWHSYAPLLMCCVVLKPHVAAHV